MPIVALAITKSVSFQGATEEFSNVYTLDSGTFDISGDWSGVAEHYANAERPVHAQAVRFLRWNVWSIGGAPNANVMIDAGDLTGNGTGGAGVPIYRECAVLVQFQLSRSAVLRRFRSLKKWIHCCELLSGGPNSESSAGAAVLAAADITRFNNYAAAVRSGPVGAGVFLTDAQGERPGPATVGTFLEHRQFHR